LAEFAFILTDEQIQNSNIQSFMKKHNISSLTELSDKAKSNLDCYWKAVDEDIGIVWEKNYEKICFYFRVVC